MKLVVGATLIHCLFFLYVKLQYANHVSHASLTNRRALQDDLPYMMQEEVFNSTKLDEEYKRLYPGYSKPLDTSKIENINEPNKDPEVDL